MAETLTKYVEEVRDYTFDFSQQPELNPPTSDTLTSAVITDTPTGDLTIGTPTVNATDVVVEIGGGIAGKDYTLKCVAVTVGGKTLVGCGILSVVAC